MKIYGKYLLMACIGCMISLSSSVAQYNPPYDTSVANYKSATYITKEGKLIIALDKEKGKSINVYLKNADGIALFNQRMCNSQKKYRMSLDLSELPDGAYLLEITDGAKAITRAVAISTHQPQPVTTNRIIAFT